MGGINSGLSTHRRTVESMLALDVRKLNRDGSLKAGTQSMASWSSRGRHHSRAAVSAGTNTITVEYSMTDNKLDVKQTIWLTTTPCNYGRERVWFCCPNCRRRVAIVYLSNRVACRTCHNLNYRSQRETDNDRGLRRLHRIQDKLNSGTYSAFETTPQRPKYMKREKYNRLRLEHIQAQASTMTALRASIERL